MTMKAYRPFLILAVLLALVGCKTTPPTSPTYTHRDGLGGPDLDMTLDNLLESSEDRSYLIWLNAVRIREGLWDSRYYLEVRYEGASDAGFMDIGPGQTLILNVDGKTMQFAGPGSIDSRSKTGRGTFLENAVYEATADQLRDIAKAKDVKVEILGKNRRLHREFQATNVQKFRSFVLTYIGY
jgi:hypothetical protein